MEEKQIRKELEKINHQLEDLGKGVMWLVQVLSSNEEDDNSGQLEHPQLNLEMPKEENPRRYIG